jgi:hypothetical protein
MAFEHSISMYSYFTTELPCFELLAYKQSLIQIRVEQQWYFSLCEEQEND